MRGLLPAAALVLALLSPIPAFATTAAEYRAMVEETQEEIDETEAEIEELEEQIADTETSITELEYELETKQATLAEQVEADYKDGGSSGLLEILLASESLTDLVCSLRYANAVYDYETACIEEVEATKETLEAERASLVAKQEALDYALEELLVEYQEREQLLAEQEELESSSASAIASTITNTDSGDSPEEAAEYALTKVGCSYVWGGSGPYSFDCSGLTMWAYALCGYSLPHNSQMQLNQVKAAGNLVYKISALEVGDLVFFGSGGSTSSVYHVGVYIGNGQYVHAGNSRVGVIISDLSYNSNYCGGGSPV